MKTLSIKEINLGSKIVKTLGMNKVAIAVTNFNVETNNIDKRMFLYSNDTMTLYTSGTTFFGKLLKTKENFVFNTKKNAPLIIGNSDYKRCISLKLDIAKIFEENKETLEVKNAYYSIVNSFESVLAYVIKNGFLNGRYTQTNTQIKYDWALNPENIIILNESTKEPEVAITINNQNTNRIEGVVTMTKRDVMGMAHKIRKEMEKENKEYAAYDYVIRMAIALTEAWDLYKKQFNKSKINYNEASKEVAPDVVDHKEVAATKTNDSNVIDINSLKSKNEPEAKCDGKIKRQKGFKYVVSEPGLIMIEDYTGKILKKYDVSKHLFAGKYELGTLHVKFTERMFAESPVYNKNAGVFIVVTDKPDEYSRHQQPRAFVPTGK